MDWMMVGYEVDHINLLDLPEEVDLPQNQQLRYFYGPSGNLLIAQHLVPGEPTRVRRYVGDLVFEGDQLAEVRHAWGRVLTVGQLRYQYNLTDHLGSTRVVLQEDPANFSVVATFEPEGLEAESQQFMDYESGARIASELFDHTGTGETGYALRLSDGMTGPARSVSVLPGDTVRMEVYGKYLDLREAKVNPALMAIALSLSGISPGSLGVDGNLSRAAGAWDAADQSLTGLLVGKEKRGDAPPAYLNYLFFDKEMNYKYGGYTQMTEEAYEDGTNREHERLYQEVVAEEPGYFYIYLSNDGTEGGEAFFDDFTILNLESYIVQQSDYYPYGLIARNFVRQGEKETLELFQGKTYEELTGWYDFHARQYDAALGRWFGVDPQNQFASPYLAMGNNPVMMVDPDGELAWFVIPVIVGAVTGGINVATNWSAIQAAGGGWSSFGAAAASFGVGFAAGAGATLGAGAAAPALTAALGTGAASGAALGAIGGGISGFTLGAGNTWMNGGGFLNGLGAGAAGAGIGALTGGVTGGTFSGVKSLIKGKNFWTGLPKVGSGSNYSNYDLGVKRPKLGSDFPKRELPRIDGPLNRASPNPGGNPDIGNIRIDLEMGRAAKGGGMYIPKTPLAQQNVAGWDIPLPDPLAGKFPHTTLGGKIGSNGILYRQSATFTGGSWPLANGKIVPWSRVDWTTHGRPLVHPNPHQHIFNFNNGINWRYGKAVPFP